MPATLTDTEFKLFQQYIKDNCGIRVEPERSYLIETRLSRLMYELNAQSFEQLYHRIVSSSDAGLKDRVIDAITTNETLWFRDGYPWDTLEKLLMPYYIEQLTSGKKRRIRIWSAAASTGQEAYSAAMCISNYLESNSIKGITLRDFEILATDISKTALDIAINGRYDAISIMRGMRPGYKEQYFAKDGRVWQLNDDIKKAVTFKHFNLQRPFELLGRFDLVLCRYVLIYFSEELRRSVIDKLKQAVLPGGIMFIGATEICSRDEAPFVVERFNEATFYRKSGETE